MCVDVIVVNDECAKDEIQDKLSLSSVQTHFNHFLLSMPTTYIITNRESIIVPTMHPPLIEHFGHCSTIFPLSTEVLFSPSQHDSREQHAEYCQRRCERLHFGLF